MEVNPVFPAKTVPEFIAYAKADPAKINMATAGSGSMLDVYGELFMMMAGVDMMRVPYRGAPPAVTDLIGGRVQVVFDTFAASIEFVRAGKLRALAVTTATRSPALPNVPPLGDFLPGYDASTWLGIGAPKNTPPRHSRETQQEDQRHSRRSLDASADCELWLLGVCKFARGLWQVHRRGHSEMGQGGEVRGHQAGLIRGHSRIFHNLSFREYSRRAGDAARACRPDDRIGGFLLRRVKTLLMLWTGSLHQHGSAMDAGAVEAPTIRKRRPPPRAALHLA
jgi:hypothetical protein